MPYDNSALPSLSRRRIGRTLVAAAASAALPRRPAAAAAHTITFTGFTGWLEDGFKDVVIPAFRKVRPDIGVFFNPVETSQQALGLLRSGRSFPNIDLVILDQATAERATADGLLQIVLPTEMPAIAELMEMAILPRSAAPVLGWNCLAIGYNKALTRNPPKTWRDLWNGAVQQLAVQRPPDLVGVALTQAASVLFGGRGDIGSLELGLNALTSLAPRVTVWTPRPDIYRSVALGDAAIGVGWNGPALAQAAKMPNAYGVIIPSDGTLAMPLTIGLVKNAPENEAGRAFMAWLLGREGQRVLTEALGLAPAAAETGIAAPLLQRAGGTVEQMRKWMPADWTALINGRDDLATAWRRRNLGPL